MTRTGRPPEPYARRHGLFVRLSDVEWGALVKTIENEHPVSARRPTMAEWARELLVAHASEVLTVEVSRSALRHQEGGAPNWKRWRLSKAVRQAAARRRTRRR